jgi:hypothetical protein
MNVRKTKNGWVVEVAHRAHGMLEQGGVVGREELYKRETLERVGIDYNDDPQGMYNDSSTNIEALLHNVERPDKVLKAGEAIE